MVDENVELPPELERALSEERLQAQVIVAERDENDVIYELWTATYTRLKRAE